MPSQGLSVQTILNRAFDPDNNRLNTGFGAADQHIPNGFGLVVGHTAQITSGSTTEFQVVGTGSPDSAGLFGRWSADGAEPAVHFVKSRNASIGSFTIVQDNDVVGGQNFYPDDGVDYATLAGRFRAEVDDASPAAGDIGMAFVFSQMPGGGGAIAETWRMPASGQFISGGIVANPANVTADGSIIAEGGLAFTDVANAHIDDATHGAGTVTHYIGNQTIDTTASAKKWKKNLIPVNGGAREHLAKLSDLLQEYDYKNGEGHFIGMVAEDVKRSLPQYVVGADTPSLRYHYMVGPLMWGWRDHEARLAALEARLG